MLLASAIQIEELLAENMGIQGSDTDTTCGEASRKGYYFEEYKFWDCDFVLIRSFVPIIFTNAGNNAAGLNGRRYISTWSTN